MNKAVFVTGAAAGTGLACAERFASEGYDVFITSREENKAQASANEIAKKHGVFAMGFGLEVGNEDSVKKVFDRIDETGRFVETVILNAANLGFGTDPAKGMDFFTTDISDIRNVFETNLVWNYMIVRQAALRMRAQGKGAVVFISSNTAYRAIPNRAAYGASKGGINAMARALAVDLGQYGIRVNVVLPGTIKTERWRKMGSKQIVNGKLTPIGDISDFEDIANAAWYLGSDQSKNVTGTEITVDGGMTCQLYPKYLNELAKRYLEEDT
ncbi:MAG: SDR family oxidoreductase [Clostridia bacterium]|nr:SDR family oxidoreductase [Clostridia bacterium]